MSKEEVLSKYPKSRIYEDKDNIYVYVPYSNGDEGEVKSYLQNKGVQISAYHVYQDKSLAYVTAFPKSLEQRVAYLEKKMRELEEKIT